MAILKWVKDTLVKLSGSSSQKKGALRTGGRAASRLKRSTENPRVAAVVEDLESRILLTAQVQTSLQDLPVWQSRVSPELAQFAQRMTAGDVAGAAQTVVNNQLMVDAQGSVLVSITAHDVVALQQHLEASGFVTTGRAVAQHVLEGFISANLLGQADQLANIGLLGISPVYRPESGVGLVDDQADVVLETNRVRGTAPGMFDGSGMRIGILSDSFNRLGGYAADITSGDLPAGVTIQQEGPSSGIIDEGRAMAQLVYDLAPGATLAFASAFFGQADFGNQIRALASSSGFNADVITDDIFYFEEPIFQDGLIAQAIDEVVTNQNVAYFALAGNLARQAYETTDISFTADSVGTFAGQLLDFDPGAGVDTRQRITVNNGQTIRINLQWDDPFFTTNGVDTDLDIFVLNGDTVVASSVRNNVSMQVPSEYFQYTNTSGSTALDVVIRRTSGAGTDPTRLKYTNPGANNFGGITFVEFGTDSPTVVAHAGATHAIGVGAVPYFNQTSPESFTSAGPLTILFDAAGNRLTTPEIRNAPHIASIDATNTTFFGSDIGLDADSHPNFFGTSAAAPHAAAVGALMLQANSSLSPAQIRTILMNTAIDIGAPGFDPLTGAGLINAYDAIFGAATPASTDFTDDFSSGVLGINWETRSTVNGRIQVLDNFGTVSGDHHIVMDTFDDGFSGGSSLNEAILHVNLLNATTASLQFTQQEFGDEDNTLPDTFTGSVNGDGVSFSVDGINWFRLVSLTGSASSLTPQTFTFDLVAEAAGRGVALSANTRIKFQQFDNQRVATDGMAFDDVSVSSTTPNTAPVINAQAFGVAENSLHGTIVGTVVASDPDVGQTLTYSINPSTNTDGAFSINPLTGLITVNNSTAITLGNSPFQLLVRVTDNGDPNLFSEAIVTVTVLPVNQRATTLFLDFGLGIGMRNTFSSTAGTFRNIFGNGINGFGTGSDLTDSIANGGLGNGSASLDFTPFEYDFDGDLDTDNDDLIALANAVVPIVQRAMEPFDIEVVVVGSANFAEALAQVQLNDGNAFGEFDAYNFIMDITSDALGGESVGDHLFDPDSRKDGKDGLGLFGIAAADDLFTQLGNRQDEATLTFLDTVFNSTTGTQGTAQFNQNLAYRVAYTATHEAFHTLSYVHTTGVTSGQTLLTSGDVIRLGSVTRENPYFVTRFDLQRQGSFAVAEPNNYLLAANDSDIGLRDNNRDGTPDFAFVTGTGAHDRITLTRVDSTTVSVLVEAFSNAARTTLIASETYNIDLTTDTEGSILIDGGINRDEIIIDGTIAATIRLRGGTGLDGVSGEGDILTLVGTGTDTPSGTGSGQVIATGGAVINYEEIEAVNVPSVGGNNPPTIDPATFVIVENALVGTVVGTPTASDPDAGQALTWAITGGNASGAFTINTSTGQITVANSTPLDFETTPTFSLTVRVTDNGATPLSAQATITINLTNVNEAPVIGNFMFTIPENSPNGTVVGTVSGTDPDGTGGTQTHVSSNVPLPLPDLTTTTSTLTVAGRSGAITDVNVTLNLNHTFDSDLEITLIAPDGTRITLSANEGGGGNNFTDTTFDDEAATPISSGVAPFSGSFRPEQLLSMLDGKNANGVWQLEIDDQVGGDAGTLNSWSLTIATAATSQLMYSLSGPNSSAFAINPVTGQITVANSTLLDFETNPVFNLIVTASDGELSDTGNVTINLTDVFEATSRLVAFGAGPYILGLPYVDVFDAMANTRKFRILAYENTFRGGVKVATGDIDKDGTDDVVVVPGKGRKTDVKIFSGVNGQLLGSFRAFAASYTGGASVDLGDVNNDGWLDVVVGNSAGVAPEVQVWNVRNSLTNPALLRTIRPFEAAFRGGMDVGVGDVNGDNFADVVVGRGAGGAATIQVYSGQNGALLKSFDAYAAAFKGGISVDVGDFNRDGRADIVTGAGAGMLPEVMVYSGLTVLNAGTPVALQKFLAYPNTYRGGVNVALRPALAPGAPAGSMEIWTGYNSAIPTRQATRFGFRAALPPLVLQTVLADTSFLGGLYVG
ncbi:MAG: cadherin domain-containing protein [Planctomycetaceae bacterium]|nr:cadherin domain-containing protein [Planctomycetaceae bacterium]